MALHQLHRSIRAPSLAALAALESALSSFRISPQRAIPSGRRNASHQAQGRANGPKDGAGKRLGAKKTDGMYVVPGNILYKQRGTGRDHTIHAGVPGYVKYYVDPALHKKRKYIGVVFERGNTLPQPPNAVRRRKLGMLAYQMPLTTVQRETGDLANADLSASSDDAAIPPPVLQEQPQEARKTKTIRTRRDGEMVETKLTLRPGYQWRQTNWEIARNALQSKAATSAKTYKPGDRFAAWRKRAARVSKNAERRSIGRASKGKKKSQKQAA
ncbi:54S ribosomal protein L2 mitochondrial [Vermiconidia calcicola]|uniref:54S ribosomal protein L2 mitochondrial n=1 Tax=Vermiconidia calcicola TaxID=1690605 RepID=A0ACC3N0K1_9PEZI|nr:54S ribosomal protein L2 mitochondrial [Vermiconidia calcicola]